MAKAPGCGDSPAVPTTRAIVTRLTRLTDTSLIVHWFTQDHGLVKTVVKGARRPGSPFAGKLDLFFGGEMCWVRARRGELHILRDVAIHEWRERLRQHYSSTLLAAYFGQLLELAVEPEHPDPLLYDLLQRALEKVIAVLWTSSVGRRDDRPTSRTLRLSAVHYHYGFCG